MHSTGTIPVEITTPSSLVPPRSCQLIQSSPPGRNDVLPSCILFFETNISSINPNGNCNGQNENVSARDDGLCRAGADCSMLSLLNWFRKILKIKRNSQENQISSSTASTNSQSNDIPYKAGCLGYRALSFLDARHVSILMHSPRLSTKNLFLFFPH